MARIGKTVSVEERSLEALPSQNRLRAYLRAAGAVVWKDLTAEWNSREMLSAMLVFGLLVILIFNFALELDPTIDFARENLRKLET